jgi:hypothetical protein
MKFAPVLLLTALPLAAQWDLRLEIPRPKGQSLPQTLITGTGDLVAGGFDTGKGFIATANRRIFTFGPILRLEGGLEYARWTADGTLTASGPSGVKPTGTGLKQEGVGAELNLQVWIPFVGLAGELGVIERFQRYTATAPGVDESKDLARPWLRVGARWRLPIPIVHPYLAASYQQPITKDHPVQVGSASDLQAYFSAQGNGQEFERMWTFGVGVSF